MNKIEKKDWTELVIWTRGHPHLFKARKNKLKKNSIVDDFAFGGTKWTQYNKIIQKGKLAKNIVIYVETAMMDPTPIKIYFIVIETWKMGGENTHEGKAIYNKALYKTWKKADSGNVFSKERFYIMAEANQQGLLQGTGSNEDDDVIDENI